MQISPLKNENCSGALNRPTRMEILFSRNGNIPHSETENFPNAMDSCRILEGHWKFIGILYLFIDHIHRLEPDSLAAFVSSSTASTISVAPL